MYAIRSYYVPGPQAVKEIADQLVLDGLGRNTGYIAIYKLLDFPGIGLNKTDQSVAGSGVPRCLINPFIHRRGQGVKKIKKLGGTVFEGMSQHVPEHVGIFQPWRLEMQQKLDFLVEAL